MRIITGQYKGRHFDIPRSFKARPTTDFAKENIFNVLQDILISKIPLPSTFLPARAAFRSNWYHEAAAG